MLLPLRSSGGFNFALLKKRVVRVSRIEDDAEASEVEEVVEEDAQKIFEAVKGPPEVEKPGAEPVVRIVEEDKVVEDDIKNSVQVVNETVDGPPEVEDVVKPKHVVSVVEEEDKDAGIKDKTEPPEIDAVAVWEAPAFDEFDDLPTYMYDEFVQGVPAEPLYAKKVSAALIYDVYRPPSLLALMARSGTKPYDSHPRPSHLALLIRLSCRVSAQSA
ncbi:hypothetical protein DFH06DRAFT_1314293 [Mycena polygramma]|nr:hypothetical protein DFH06DRAFT_1314293 [Mycena polygramma]